MATVQARRRSDPGAKELFLVEPERVRVAPRGGAEIAPPRISRIAVPVAAPVEVVVTRPVRVRTRRPWSDQRKRRFRRRFLPTATALVLAPVPITRLLIGGAGPAPLPLPPVSFLPQALPQLVPLQPSRGGSSTVMPDIVWHHSISLGLPYHGRLIDGVQLPVASPYWVTWDPVFNRVPNRGYRRYGSAKLIHLLLKVTQAYHQAHPDAARLVIGDLSRRGGGPFLDEHASHQNGLDVDIYYPRLDHREVAPTTVAQVDVKLSQDLLNQFVAAGAEFVFVGPHLPLHGPPDVVEPLIGHDNHMHVRIYPPK